MYCSACTGKYHVPVNFHGLKKHKTGPVRVCNTCKDGCLKEKKKVRARAISTSLARHPA